jgi:hypothetical protein
MRLHDGEPVFVADRLVPLSGLLEELLHGRRPPEVGPFLVAVDGRSANGKSTLANALADATPGTHAVHTDDIAWWHSRFGWDDLLIRGVIAPLRRGEAVRFRPPAWEARGRPGHVEVNGGARVVLIEGVGSARAGLAEEMDAVIWVQSDVDVAHERDLVRIAAGETDLAGYEAWMDEEVPFQNAERTWERADLVVCGSSDVPHDPRTHAVVGGRRSRRQTDDGPA